MSIVICFANASIIFIALLFLFVALALLGLTLGLVEVIIFRKGFSPALQR